MAADPELIERFISEEPALLSSLDFGPWVVQGRGAGPSLLIGDQSEISLLRHAQSSYLDYRMAHLAQPGDVVLVRNRDIQFEAYLTEFCGLSDVVFLSGDIEDGMSLAQHANTSPLMLRRLVDVTRAAGGLTITSYLTTENTWRLAQAIGRAAQCIVYVNGPSPRVSMRANDKLWFTRLARQVIGTGAVPPTMSAYGPDAAAALLLRFSKTAQQVIVKVPDSAGSAGNLLLKSSFISKRTVPEIRKILQERLHAIGWDDSFPILIGVWDADVICTPSVQLSIPRIGDGPVVSHGVFEQQMFAETTAFAGAIKSTLPDSVQSALLEQSVRIATVLQHLGYYGRCSFDAVICKRDDSPHTIHWIECNGRWGGVSIPLAVLGSIVPDDDGIGLMITQTPLVGQSRSTSEVIKSLNAVLYHHDTSKDGVILMSPPSSLNGSTINLLVFGKVQSDVAKVCDRAIEHITTGFNPD